MVGIAFFLSARGAAPAFLYLNGCLTDGVAPELEVAGQYCDMDDTQALRLLMSELLSQIEHFMVYQERFKATAHFHCTFRQPIAAGV
ncbi:MAG: hypothetical protein IPL65_01475 [Lewinellaceae bacterium]|nr:hypothetical protein [Lewinellaceae bacterium]